MLIYNHLLHKLFYTPFSTNTHTYRPISHPHIEWLWKEQAVIRKGNGFSVVVNCSLYRSGWGVGAWFLFSLYPNLTSFLWKPWTFFARVLVTVTVVVKTLLLQISYSLWSDWVTRNCERFSSVFPEINSQNWNWLYTDTAHLVGAIQ